MDPRKPTVDETEVLDFVTSSGKEVAPLGPPGTWDNFGAGLGESAFQGLARTGRAALVAGAAPVVLLGTEQAQDWYFRNVVDELGGDAVDHWAPNAANVGAAGQTLNGLVSSLIPLAAGGGNPAPLLATTALDTPVDLLNQGATLGSAVGVGAIQTAATAAGFRLPAAWGNSLMTRLATGAGGNLALGEASRDLSQRALAAGGNDALAELYGGDSTAAFIDIGMGLAFGGLAHLQAPRAVSRTEQAALLTASNAHHMSAGTAPGRPVDAVAQAAHDTAVETAVRQLLDGERVNVAAAIPDAPVTFQPRARSAAPADAGSYDAFRHALESGGRADAANPASSALGVDQFTAGTWRAMVAKTKPAWAEGLTDQQLLAARKDPAKSAEMERALRAENAAALEAAGVQVDNLTLYAAHHFGAERAIAFANAADDAKVDTFLTAGQIKANAYLRGMTKGELVANWQRRAGVAQGAREAFPQPDALARTEFLARTRALEIPDEAAAQILPAIPRDAVTGFHNARDGSTKADVVRRAQEHVGRTGEEAHYVSADLFNLGGLNEFVGNRAEVANEHYGAIARIFEAELQGTGADVVPMRTGGDEFGAVVVNAQGPAIAAALERAQVRVGEYARAKGLDAIPHPKRKGEKGVGIHAGIAAITPDQPLRTIFDQADDGVHLSKHGKAAAPRAPRAVEPSGKGQGAVRGRGAQQPVQEGAAAPAGGERAAAGMDYTAAANDALAEFPDLLIAGDDGAARPAADVLAEAEDALQLAEVEVRAIDAAVNCFLRTGT